MFYGALREAVTAARGRPGTIPVAAIHRTGRGGERFAAIPWETFLRVAEVLHEVARGG